MYSYSRSFKHQQNRSFERSAVDSLFDVIFQNPSEYSFLSIIPNRLSVSNSVFLLSSFINFNYFPAGKVDIVLSKVLPQIDSLSDDQCFAVLCTLLKTQSSRHRDVIASSSTPESVSAGQKIFHRYIEGYDQIAKRGVTSNLMCLFLRYAAAVTFLLLANSFRTTNTWVPPSR